jgi:hypothetical protein
VLVGVIYITVIPLPDIPHATPIRAIPWWTISRILVENRKRQGAGQTPRGDTHIDIWSHIFARFAAFYPCIVYGCWLIPICTPITRIGIQTTTN